MPPQQNHAQPDTLLGLLQRGRGEGYRQLLAISRRDAREPLLDCICNDPRLDRQVESRAGYYAGLAIETDLDLNPVIRYVREYDDKDQGWNTTLAIQTLGELAKRDYKESVGMLCDYVQWGQWWDWILEDLIAGKDSSLQASVASIIEERFPGDTELEEALCVVDLNKEPCSALARFSAKIGRLKDRPGRRSEPRLPADAHSLSAGQLLQLADNRNYWMVAKVIRQVVKPADLDLLMRNVSLGSPYVAYAALAGLAALAPPTIFEWLKELWSSNSTMPGFLRARERGDDLTSE